MSGLHELVPLVRGWHPRRSLRLLDQAAPLVPRWSDAEGLKPADSSTLGSALIFRAGDGFQAPARIYNLIAVDG